ncbi:Methylthioribulose-1-phosphate dehydratase [Metschnikowia bicuspidata]|uniref:Methylthioribulose-1-phosphate dehydratase n=1 Tax=Metschnikowia bicuspidata TaxID=27322 RepID=A0A4P9ZJ93_9ASCO|nr:Methylthioribulose-1-phosphate dehydratase [Metschnikowia bicuspidata]
MYETKEFSPNHPASLICEFCRLFYNNGWVTGTGGGISIRDVDGPNPNIVYIAPSGIQKERLQPAEMFVVELPGKIIQTPNDEDRPPLSHDLAANFKYKPLACTPLFLSCYYMRDAGSCIHTHSQNVVMATLIWEDKVELSMSHIEHIKALPQLQRNKETGKVEKVGSMQFYDTMVLPIIENTPQEEDLTDSFQEAIENYPGATAVLVRRHGIYVWGETVWKAKVYNEAIDYLLELALKMHAHGIPLTKEAAK